jgi:hypothetical protein
MWEREDENNFLLDELSVEEFERKSWGLACIFRISDDVAWPLF